MLLGSSAAGVWLQTIKPTVYHGTLLSFILTIQKPLNNPQMPFKYIFLSQDCRWPMAKQKVKKP